MLQEAIITKTLDNGLAEVVVERSGICGGDCDECNSCRYEKLMKTVVQNPIEAHRGQHVYIEMPTSGVLKGALYIYILPLVMLFVGYFVGYFAELSESYCIVCAFGGVLLGIGIAALLSTRQHKSNPTPAKIISVIHDQE